MQDNLQARTLAFAALCQAVWQVQQLARYGRADEEAMSHTLGAVMITDPDSVESVYDRHQLNAGFRTLVDQIGDGNRKDVDLTRYIVGILALERKLAKNSAALGMLSERINQVKRQLHHFELTDPQVLANLASIYSDVISPLGAKIQVVGNPEQLQQSNNQARIRALLLGAIRAAVLWRQLGGKRRQLMFSRGAMVKAAMQALK
ncbi:high frequency lysogenization protein HflD [Ferrimonas sediminicola]|uniref:High frequency lysogenization protein HflD homolog n=1 Tax=Ferrimonas sediminicola TaxID=2569538 RepID=A0A4U1BFV9_9GAMM|nr:high frequency lysogenization protein HflD [Ferrimonas sediminicola]TKB48901.1 high frequency lysogenization protein HflD [Ferrimonas sediminicola]